MGSEAAQNLPPRFDQVHRKLRFYDRFPADRWQAKLLRLRQKRPYFT
jgi:hypothetical protein